MATTPSFQGFLTDEQKESRDKFRRQMQGEYLFDLIQANSKLAMGAATMSDHRQAMPAIIVREHEEQTLTMLAQTGGEETTSSISAQTESEKSCTCLGSMHANGTNVASRNSYVNRESDRR